MNFKSNFVTLPVQIYSRCMKMNKVVYIMSILLSAMAFSAKAQVDTTGIYG